MSNFSHPLDARLQHRAPGLAALAASTVLATLDEGVAQRTVYKTVVVLESIDVANSNESYKLVVELSDDDFATVSEVAYILEMGAGSTRQSVSSDSAVGDSYEFLWTTQANDVSYQYARLNLVVAGTSPSIGLMCHSTLPGAI